MNLFAQIRKVDEAKRLVFGRIAEEAVDKAGEVMDYAASKPHFVKWSEDVAKATDGASLGNVRAMHGNVAAGKLTGIDFNDAEKVVDVCAKVVDDNEWGKVLEGVYTGFSIGGAYVGEKTVEKMADGSTATRYTAAPSEVSLVDRPCMPGARFFEVQKADGALAKVDFQHQPEADASAADDVTVNGTADQVAELGKLMNANGLTLDDVLTKALPAFLADKKKGAKTSTDPDGDGDAAADTDGDGDGGKPATGAGASAEAIKCAEKAQTTAGADALAAAQTAFDLAKAALEAAGGTPAALAKVEADTDTDTAALQKLVSDAITPLQKRLDDADALAKAQDAEIAKLKAQPAPTTIRLRAVAKHEDIDANEPLKKAAPAEVVDDHGEKHEAAGLIKNLHASGGSPLRELQK